MADGDARSFYDSGLPDEGNEGIAVLSPGAFTGLFAACLRQSSSDLSVKVTGELELETGENGSNSRKAFLDNAYSVYLQNPEARDEVIDGFVASHLDLIKEGVSQSIDIMRIVPVVKDKSWLQGLAVSLAAHDSPSSEGSDAAAHEADATGNDGDNVLLDSPDAGGAEINTEPGSQFPVPIHESLNSELDVVYAEDSPHNIRYLNHTNLDSIGIELDQLRALAIQNLTSMLKTQVEVHGDEGVYLIMAGGNYEASFLLLDEFWESSALKVDGDYVVAIPTRDVLLITGSHHSEGIDRIRSAAGEASSRGAYSLTPVLFVRKNGEFEVFEG